MLFSLFTVLFALITSIHAVPLASPETRGASGECSPPEVEILSTEKQKQGPYLVSGARSDANPRGGKKAPDPMFEGNSHSHTLFRRRVVRQPLVRDLHIPIWRRP